jgi:hypothetical protein
LKPNNRGEMASKPSVLDGALPTKRKNSAIKIIPQSL